ncbi:MAG: hypothetical protein PUE01_00020 [Clostridiaceae bacterium]|nr:hypothetical protein [Clostridiaceae bacterium]
MKKFRDIYITIVGLAAFFAVGEIFEKGEIMKTIQAFLIWGVGFGVILTIFFFLVIEFICKIEKSERAKSDDRYIEGNSIKYKKEKKGFRSLISEYYSYGISVIAICWGLQIFFGRLPRVNGINKAIFTIIILMIISVIIAYGRGALHIHFSDYSEKLRTIVRITVDVLAFLINLSRNGYRFRMITFLLTLGVLYIVVVIINAFCINFMDD